MTRLAWMVVLPWAVIVDSTPFTGPSGYQAKTSAYVTYKGDYWGFACAGDRQDSCQDFVDAMNAAHERRDAAKVLEDHGCSDCTDAIRALTPKETL